MTGSINQSINASLFPAYSKLYELSYISKSHALTIPLDRHYCWYARLTGSIHYFPSVELRRIDSLHDSDVIQTMYEAYYKVFAPTQKAW
jgi:hypothetical protein